MNINFNDKERREFIKSIINKQLIADVKSEIRSQINRLIKNSVDNIILHFESLVKDQLRTIVRYDILKKIEGKSVWYGKGELTAEFEKKIVDLTVKSIQKDFKLDNIKKEIKQQILESLK